MNSKLPLAIANDGESESLEPEEGCNDLTGCYHQIQI